MKAVNLTVRQWGNSLGVRIPAAIAKAAGIELDQPVRVMADDGKVIIQPIGERKLSLAEKLDRFDPARHGGEVMVTGRVGAEIV
jgi:antitoxin MazE